MIVGFRVDERLVHGQVALAWSRVLGSEAILVGNDKAANDQIQKTALKLAAPAGLKLVVSTVEKTISLLNNQKANDMKLLVVVKSVEDALKICEKVNGIEEVNVASAGRYSSDAETNDSQEREEVIKGEVYLAKSGLEAVKKLWDMGIEVYNQQLPSQNKRIIKKGGE